MQKAFVNGEILSFKRAKISIFDRGFLFGDGVYEVIKVKKGNVLFLSEHLQRLKNSLKEAEIPYPENFEEGLNSYIKLLKNKTGALYIEITRGAHIRRHLPPENLKPTVVIFYFPFEFYKLKEVKKGFVTYAIRDFRWQRCDIKSVSLMGAILAKLKSHKVGADEVLFLDEKGNIREGGSTNFYAVVKNKIYTHPLGKHLLKGVVRGLVSQISRDLEIEFIEKAPSIFEIEKWDEAFISGTLTGIMPVNSINGIKIKKVFGPVTKKIYYALKKFETI